MSELNGIGAHQPIRPLTGARAAAPRPAAEATPAPSGFGEDTAEVRQAAAPTAPQAPPAAETPAKADAGAQVQRPQYEARYDPTSGTVSFAPARMAPRTEEYDGFMVAGAGLSNTASTLSLGTPGWSGTGPITVIEDPVSEVSVDFPDLDLNGPSTAAEGFFGLSGKRLA